MAKLLETGLVNMDRIEILWRPLTAHLLEVSSFNSMRVRVSVILSVRVHVRVCCAGKEKSRCDEVEGSVMKLM